MARWVQSVLLLLLPLVLSGHAAVGMTEVRAEPVPGPIVQLKSGKVQGIISDGVMLFKGIPYAGPVGGSHRWKAPQPASHWKGVLKANTDSPACAQPARYNLTENSEVENCLFLNVARPAVTSEQMKDQDLPVLVWIHGGAFAGGSSVLYRIDKLARQLNAVVVTFNYRLGVFGFMAHPAFDKASNGSYALLDQQLAMKWVKDNISAFGGDPNNITLAGESAGASAVCIHLAVPEHTKGLFHKAIMTSAACSFALRDLQKGYEFGQKVAAKVGCDKASDVVGCLRRVPVGKLVAAGEQVAGSDLMAYTPVYGSQVVPRMPRESLDAGKILKVPVLYGGTRDELRLYVGYDVQVGNPVTHENFAQKLAHIYGGHAKDVLDRYPLRPEDSPPALLGTIMTHFHPAVGLNHCQYVDTAKLLSRHVPVFMIEFADRDVPVLGVSIPAEPDPGFELGAAHSSDLNYFFPNFSNTSRMDAPDLNPDSQAMADNVIEAWGRFMRTGIVSADNLPQWLPFNMSNEALRVQAREARMIDPFLEANCDFWRKLYPSAFSVLTE